VLDIRLNVKKQVYLEVIGSLIKALKKNNGYFLRKKVAFGIST